MNVGDGVYQCCGHVVRAVPLLPLLPSVDCLPFHFWILLQTEDVGLYESG